MTNSAKDALQAAKKDIARIADLLAEVAAALRDAPEHVIFANGGSARLSIDPAITPRTFDAHAWPDVKRINAALARLNAAQEELKREHQRHR
jgi:hypothetical protein